ncbi:MAG: AI-2E family transporter [Bradymonadia bacterium]
MSRRASDFDVSSKIAVRLLAVCLIGLLLHYLSLVVIPMVFAILICLLQFPIIRFLAQRRLPVAVGLFAAEILVFGPLLAFGYLLVSSLGPLAKQLPFYQERLLRLSSDGLTYVLNAIGQDGGDIALRKEIVDNVLRGVLQEGVEIVESSLGAVTSAIGGLSLTVVFSVFILLEATRWREKFSDAFSKKHPLLLSMSTIGQDVRRYVLAKSWLSILTGGLVWLCLEALEVDFAILWGLIALPLNFIPTVGAIIASVPPILIAIVDPSLDWVSVGGVVFGLAVINGLVGTLLDPKYVGNAVKLSPLVVLLSMIVWGLMWGPMGMLLGVPIMVAVKLVLAQSEEFKAVAKLMDA